MNTAIYTISRQYGSGGRIVGKEIAEILDIPFYDNTLLRQEAIKSGIDISHYESDTQKKSQRKSLLQSIYQGVYGGGQSIPGDDQLALSQFKAIREIAKKGPCVFIGRCADHVLQERPNVISVFVTASLQSRIKRAVEEYGVAKDEAEKIVKAMDKEREDYYQFYAGRSWSDADSYDLTVSTDRMSCRDAAEIIIEAAHRMTYK